MYPNPSLMLRYIGVLLCVILLSDFGLKGQGQDAPRFLEVRGTSELDMQPLGHATATLYDGSTQVSSVQTGSDGTFSFKLEMNKQYTIEVSKNGLVSKRISFNTTMPDEEKGSWMNEFSIGLVKFCDGVDYSALKNPVDNIKFDPKHREFVSDKDYVQNMKSRLENVYTSYQNCMTDKYNAAIKKADQLFNQKNYQDARKGYQDALEIQPDQDYPKKRIADIDNLLGKQQNIDEVYKNTIAEADALMAQQRYSDALVKYKGAVTLKPQDPYATQKINDIQNIVTKQQAEQQQQASLDDQYNQAMAKASVAYTQKDFQTAQQYYKAALNIKPNESLPQARLQEVNDILSKKAAEDAKLKEIDDAYKSAVAKGDAMLRNKDYDGAKQQYQQAMLIKPSESYPKAKITEADRQEQSDARAAENAKKTAQDNEYKADITEADNLFKAKDYDGAKAAYNKALLLKPDDQFSKQRISAIDNIIVSEQNAKIKEQNDGYMNALNEANKALAQQQYPQAKDAFNKALTYKPDDAFAKNKITELDKLIQDQANQKADNEAKNKQYQQVIVTADNLLQSKDLAKARDAYTQALTIKPGDVYAQQKITSIDNMVAADQTAKQKAIEDGYKAAIGAANTAITQKQYPQAKASLEKALTFKPGDPYASGKLSEINKLVDEQNKMLADQEIKNKQYQQLIVVADNYLQSKDLAKARDAYEQALSLKPDDQYAQLKITSIDNMIAADQVAKQKAIDDGYKSAIGAANTAIAQKQYPQAKEALQKALTFKPDDAYATGKITEVDRLIEDQKKMIALQQQQTGQYNDAIAAADKLLQAGSLQPAMDAYNNALQYKPGDAYANQKITDIENRIAADAAARQKQNDDGYSNAMAAGTSAMAQQNYELAKKSYQSALGFKPGDMAATKKIADVDLLLKQAQDQAAALEAQKKQYNDAITKADQYLTQKDYPNAKIAYTQALSISPTETYPRQKLDDVNQALADQAKQEADKQANDNAYKLALASADKYYRAKDYFSARDEYSRASLLKPDENYPKTKLSEIEDIIHAQEKAQAEAKAKADAYAQAMSTGNALFDQKNYTGARKIYTEALNQKPGDQLATQQISKIDYILTQQENQKKAEEDKQNQYNQFIAEGDKNYDAGNYVQAKENYKNALALVPASEYAKQRIQKVDEILRLLANSTNKQVNVNPVSKPKVIAAIPMGELNFKTESEKQRYLDELMKKYPAGVTLEIYREKYKETWRYIIIRDNEAQEFRQVKFLTYGGSVYSVNGKPITQQYFLSQTKTRSGEAYNEIEMQ